jgi:hypothetical protein
MGSYKWPGSCRRGARLANLARGHRLGGVVEQARPIHLAHANQRDRGT